MYKLVANIVKVILKLMGSKARVYGEENLPKEGGYIIACTHTGYVDILNLGVAMYPQEIHFMAKKQLFEMKGLGWLIEHLNAFPVDRDNPGPSVIKIPSQLLKEGKVVGIFPSGTRNSEGTDLKQGAITIAQLAKAQIVPAAYVGARNAGDVMKRGKGYLIYGEPFYVTGKGKEGREQFTQHLERELVALTEELENRISVK
ncbi:1-acyl-sn-glycerol-3-phosphate acyltransferase [Lysinibacillus sp. FSL R7-0073]|uniref:1-acyl-sn-glycerol-3-phosphate acyltransferase n=1 Tax=Lysinibacillus fusiformis TaxID=28031 RepID=A0A1E4R0S4_9BACI|nr:1-acyl-sn-glycerol-3-phosphate acyltransferase [Lysinibacillus fusiformis]MBD8523198.1 1-acyl-sn-glycerol-3-phosphate acyltransferase [Lysinibacillus fusiformis]MCR8853838.1 1-acyl-sn-glycerol-3-phosphate acyltransferase [Lysinibacillus fusiformis]MED4889486.1 1-acyl-sn-glycerol-3-phosphate acyltransferase [Lysinibacillus fusiformis]ODV54060.1 acyl-phosphate glycerol 3-phosphate acyltransferase [Lysinibacillus fusiformis]WKT76200.1 1-acyl-sn-glycerol-3-phosphate acyltransferase [Lysinibacil